MGRRTLPCVAAEVDVDGHLLRLEEPAEPFSSEAIFGRGAPLEIEIGSGKGLFLVNAAQANPQYDYLGVEVAEKYARFVAARCAKKNITNARILHGDGVRFLATVPQDSVEAVHVYFPDPWWKKRHRKRRVMNASLLASIDRILVPAGRLHFWTDVQEYFATTLELIKTQSKLLGPLPVDTEPALHDMDFRTHFERRVRLNNLPVYRAEFSKPTWRLEITVDAGGITEVTDVADDH